MEGSIWAEQGHAKVTPGALTGQSNPEREHGAAAVYTTSLQETGAKHKGTCDQGIERPSIVTDCELQGQQHGVQEACSCAGFGLHRRARAGLPEPGRGHRRHHSLLPYGMHPMVARHCISHSVDLVTPSYTSPAMMELDESARNAGITVLNEMGLDPGIDHMLAMRSFDKARELGGQVESYVLFCGGLPAPECCDNPLRYKFSWSPRGVLTNTMGAARFLRGGQVVEIPAGGALLDAVEPIDFMPGLSLEGLPNRDSLSYIKDYGVHGTTTFFRGTLRYKGFCKVAKALVQMGLMNSEPHPALQLGGATLTWRELVCSVLGVDASVGKEELQKAVLHRLKGNEDSLPALQQLGLLGEEPVGEAPSLVDALAGHLERNLSFGPDERDLVILRNEVVVRLPTGVREKTVVNLVSYGDRGGYSAMAKTVGYPCAIAAKMVLSGEICEKGMVMPLHSHIYQPLLEKIRVEGITYTEKTTVQ
ncbi:alpha-aminoadipic semialdehyde synthase, mitochondrial-like isoform X1 [Petromyzon marinus]|uniref:Alpha-aminoadipic semialdehyde synthase, mitochondrial-like isoform X1 n=1 Tax=Petromyzon marinus TaxID=7757 RepID=A0AAJ7WU50_PETMA|nr:alpha-aminoadipic semialdehyde synthase, mitochondrial-like isoform X1 [Petromyzon marinus]